MDFDRYGYIVLNHPTFIFEQLACGTLSLSVLRESNWLSVDIYRDDDDTICVMDVRGPFVGEDGGPFFDLLLFRVKVRPHGDWVYSIPFRKRMPRVTREQVLSVFYTEYLPRFGLPRSVITDHSYVFWGPEFVESLFKLGVNLRSFIAPL